MICPAPCARTARASPALLPLPPDRAFLFPLTFPLGQFSFLRQCQGCPPGKREGSRVPPPPAPDRAPSSQRPGARAGWQRQRPGQKEAGPEEAAGGGGGGDAPGPQSQQPPGSLRVPEFWAHTAGVARRNCGVPATLARRREGYGEGPGSCSSKAQAGTALRSAVGLALLPPRPPFCPKKIWAGGGGSRELGSG